MEHLRIPGPTPCPSEALQAMSKQMINHRGPEFGQMLNEVTDKLKRLFQTKDDVFLLTGSGTAGLEAAIVNTLSPGDKYNSDLRLMHGPRLLSRLWPAHSPSDPARPGFL